MSRCPRCVAQVELTRWRARSPVGEVELTGCDSCGGVFIDKANLAAVCPTAAHLPDHAGEVALTGSPGAGIPFCPRCSGTPHQLELVGVLLDFCTRCHGVWLDAVDYQEAAFTEQRAAPPPRAPYRARATELTAPDRRETCSHCGEKHEPSELAFSEHGRICRGCMAARDVRRAKLATRNQSWLDDFFEALMR